MEPGIICPECNTSNEGGWSFCQQCGKQLPRSQPAAQPADLNIPMGVKTVRDQSSVEPAFERVLKTVAETAAGREGVKTVAEEAPALEPEQPPRASEPVKPDEPPVSPERPFAKTDSANLIPTVVIQAVRPPETEAPPPPTRPEKVPVAPPPAATSEPATQSVHSLSGVLCTQCGQANNVGSAFCASCGAPVTYGKTMVMSSHPAPARGRLHLVMEGGQPGEVYELGDDTVIGRSSGEISFPHDGFMSGRHARIVHRGSGFVLTDEGSRNGTFIKINGEVELKPGDMVLVGKQLFRFEE